MVFWPPVVGSGSPATPLPEQIAKNEQVLRVAVVGDTGVGDRAFHWGFLAVQKAMREKRPDVLLHLGDFVYQSEWLPKTCRPEYLREIRSTLVRPYPLRIFVPGDNDFSPDLTNPKASACWDPIARMSSPFDAGLPSSPSPGRYEGTRVIGNTLFAVLNSYAWRDPTPWLSPRIEQARRAGKWIILALHEPAITTAWYLEKRDTVLKQIDALGPDLVFSGNQHSYERFFPLGVPGPEGKLPVKKSDTGKFRRGDGTIHVISGGGGATFKPFADLQGVKDRTAPREVFDALAARALMNHFLILDISSNRIQATTYRVCPGLPPQGHANPRWRPKKSFWKSIALECDGQPVGVTPFDHFEIIKGGGGP